MSRRTLSPPTISALPRLVGHLPVTVVVLHDLNQAMGCDRDGVGVVSGTQTAVLHPVSGRVFASAPGGSSILSMAPAFCVSTFSRD